MPFHTVLRELRRKKELTQEELAKKTGLSASAISMYELGEREPNFKVLETLADFFNVDMNRLLDAKKPVQPKKRGVKIPILGTVVAGIPITAYEDILDYEEIPESLARMGTFFGLRIRGSSMEPTLQENDVIIVKQEQTCDTGDIAVVLINGDEATVKEIKRGMDGVTLIGHNVAVFPPKFYSNREIEDLPVRILGVVYEVRRKFKMYRDE